MELVLNESLVSTYHAISDLNCSALIDDWLSYPMANLGYLALSLVYDLFSASWATSVVIGIIKIGIISDGVNGKIIDKRMTYGCDDYDGDCA